MHRMTITLNGIPTVVSARRDAPQCAASVGTWIAGDICNEFVIRDLDTNIANQLNVQYNVRVFSGYDGIRVDTVVENCWSEYRGNLTYDVSLSLGQENPQVVLAKEGQLQYHCTRWHKVFWQDNTPAISEIHYDFAYMIAAGLFPNYDRTLVVPQGTISSQYNSWSNSAHDIMQPGIVTTYFPQTGGRPEIGLYPAWTVLYLYTMDNRMREVTLNCGDVGGTIPIHFRESDPTRSFVNHVMSIDDRPTIWARLADVRLHQGSGQAAAQHRSSGYHLERRPEPSGLLRLRPVYRYGRLLLPRRDVLLGGL